MLKVLTVLVLLIAGLFFSATGTSGEILAIKLTVMELKGSIQKYAWGKKGSTSLVAQLAKSSGDLEINENENYAELWIGTHPSGQAVLVDSGKPLAELIKEDPSVLGAKVVERFGPTLPFLLKVLSVEKALSIQAHPDLELAKKLHASFPDIYKDPNHKPEMAIALTPFEVMCGFRSVDKIVSYLKGKVYKFAA